VGVSFVKRRVLNLGIAATHGLIESLGTLNQPLSISDFDAFVFDPTAVLQGGQDVATFIRRQNEIRDLLGVKGGVVVCLLRQPQPIGVSIVGYMADTYSVLDQAGSDSLSRLRGTVRAGSGSRVKVLPNLKGASAGYFQVLEGKLQFAAHVEMDPAQLASGGGTVFAFDSVGHPIGVEFAIGAGRICFVPTPEGATSDRVGSALVRIVEAHYGGPGEIEAPPWLVEVGVPGATAHDAAISELERKNEQIEAEAERLRRKRADLLNYRVLLYGYGKSALEPAVRSAFRLLDFQVPDPDQYEGEWDVELHEPCSTVTAVCEVEGTEGVVDVDKYRQLLDYVQAEALEDRDHKGILVGNGYRLSPPEAQERQSQFSAHALRGAKKNGFCLLPTTELFKAVCAVLDGTQDEGQKIRIRDSIFSTVGVWTFAREVAEPPRSAAAGAQSRE
jgi:hypothetical protein